MPRLRLGPILRHVGATTATVWVETDQACVVEVLGAREPTFLACGHHYALVRVEGLAAGRETPYQVHLDGAPAWPEPVAPQGRSYPPSVIRTLAPDRPLALAFGSCRYPPQHPATRRKGRETRRDPMGPDALAAFARRLATTPPSRRPDLFAFLGDQVYADEPTEEVRRRIEQRRGPRTEPVGEVADFEEYSWLYAESWREPDVRWLLSTLPSVMIFDDHDVHDDWNTSRSWRQDVERAPWWRERVSGALMSYWIHQHLGNLSPAELDADATYCAVRRTAGTGKDVEPLLRALAERADREADGGKGYRWSFWRDLGRTRLLVLDSRCGRLLDDTRAMIGPHELEWAAQRLDADLDHVVVGTSLPWLLPPAIHDVETWDEQLADDPRIRRARLGERLRRAADLEHWAAFHRSFDELTDLLRRTADGSSGHPAPASVCVLSGDVHHSYSTRAGFPGDEAAAPVYQLTCSPLRNRVPPAMRLAFRLGWSRAAERAVRWLLTRVARIPSTAVEWEVIDGPHFGNMVATLDVDGRSLTLTVERCRPGPDGDGVLVRQFCRELA